MIFSSNLKASDSQQIEATIVQRWRHIIASELYFLIPADIFSMTLKNSSLIQEQIEDK